MGLITNLKERIAHAIPVRWQSLMDEQLPPHNITDRQVRSNSVVNSNGKRSRALEAGDTSLVVLPHRNRMQIPSEDPQDTAKALCLAIAECNRLVREVSLEEKPKKAAIWKQIAKEVGESSSTYRDFKSFPPID
jgi:hypothetical protein